jgi:hypothetical protein
MEFRAFRHRIAQPASIADRLSIDEYDHVPPDRSLVVEHIGAEARILAKSGVEDFPHRSTRGVQRRTREVLPQIGRENDGRHGPAVIACTARLGKRRVTPLLLPSTVRHSPGRNRMPGIVSTVSDVGGKKIEAFAGKLAARLITLKSQIPAGQYFELKGDLIIFRNTLSLGKDIHGFMMKVRAVLQQIAPQLRQLAVDIQREGRSIMVQLASRGALGLSSSDPSMAKLIEVLVQLGGADLVGTASGELAAHLRRFADAIEKKGKALNHGKFYVQAKVWAGFSGNAFNWRTRRFEAQGVSPLASYANRQLNPKIAAIESKVMRKTEKLTTRYYSEFLLKQVTNLGISLATAAFVAGVLGHIWDELTMQNP